ncbi:MAG: class I SAM-dependent methyltransferase [Isosphaeraceae bacterium]
MGLKQAVSRNLASRVARSQVAAIRRGAIWSFPRPTWPLRRKWNDRWLKYKVLHPVESDMQAVIDQDPRLEALRLPEPNAWNLTASARLVISALIERHRPRNLIELGGGVSTIILADYARRTRFADGTSPRICSVDHDREWLAQTTADLKDRGLLDGVELIHAPVEHMKIGGEDFATYALPESFHENHAPGSFDFCLIDGPPEILCGRAGTLPLVAPYLASGALVLLDDAFRAGEQECLRRWHERFRGNLRDSRLVLNSRGMATFRWYPGKELTQARPENLSSMRATVA